ncbi:MAG: hypothetical protein GVX90_05720 [Alphaproteobacteria bacterium]|jgi:hypothetical protein|nr:hypothetical protein [Alphaproteobacteria bacterium]
MRASLLALLAAALLLAGCASRFNPLNWFGGSEERRVAAEAPADTARPADPRPLVARISSLSVDRVPGGALVTAAGVPPTQGWFEAELLPTARDIDGAPVPEDGVMTFRFVAVPPAGTRRVGTPASREVTAGTFLSDQTLAPVRRIAVQGAENRRVSSR